MADLLSFHAAHPFWTWMALGAALLAIEAGTGSGWLLWPAASAGVVALLMLTGWQPGPAVEVLIFAGLTLVTTFLARRYIIRRTDHPDINDTFQRMIGKTGKAVTTFEHGKGRAFVANAEWAADLESGDSLAEGAPVVVTAVNGPRLVVRAG